MKNSLTLERRQEIENFVEWYFENYKVGYESSGFGSTQGTTMASVIWEHLHKNYMKKIKEIMYKKLTEKTLIDLGVGANGKNMPYGIEVPFKKYVGVDIHRPYANALYAIEQINKKGIDASLVDSDMLRYLVNIPDKSANFMLSAIDSDVILDDKYWKYLCEELYRCTEDGGIIIDAGVGHIEYYLNEMIPGKFEMVYQSNSPGGQKIFEKI